MLHKIQKHYSQNETILYHYCVSVVSIACPVQFYKFYIFFSAAAAAVTCVTV